MKNTHKNIQPNDPYNRHGSRHEIHNQSGGGKIAGIALASVALAAVLAAGLYLVDLDQTQEARLPNVDVQLTEGQMPEFDVEVADISVGSETIDVKVPTVDVETETKVIEVEVPVDVNAGTETEAIDVPTLDIERPDIDDPADDPVADTMN